MKLNFFPVDIDLLAFGLSAQVLSPHQVIMCSKQVRWWLKVLFIVVSDGT